MVQMTLKKPVNLRIAVQHASEMLANKAFIEAIQQGQEILKIIPGEPNAIYVIACAQRELGQLESARETLIHLLELTPKFALAHQELAFTLHQLDLIKPAVSALKKALDIQANLPQSWQLLSKLCLLLGENTQSELAYNRYLQFSAKFPLLREALQAFIEGNLQVSEVHCRKHLKEQPNDVSAIRLLAEIAIKLGVYPDAEQLLVRCLRLAPDYQLARLNYAHVLNKRDKCQVAMEQIDILEKHQADAPPHQIIKAAILVRQGKFREAIDLYTNLTTRFPDQAGLFTSRGHAQKTIGEQVEAIDSYRRAISCSPSYGEAYWSLANLKTFRFSPEEISQMQNLMGRQDLPVLDKINISFALGKALEDNKLYSQSFECYTQGNALKQQTERYDPNETTVITDRTIKTCVASLFDVNKGQGCQSPDPIFIVGLPRSGSTLIEQILASHSLVDGTKELPDIISIVRQLSGRKRHQDVSRYPEILSSLSAEQLRALGEEYMAQTRVHRALAPFFIDKMPNNFAHIGLIKLILPNAKIIDARRHPMSTCFSGFKQLFANGQSFTYGLENIGRYYLDYIRLMDHWHEVLPEQVLTVNYEQVVNDFENQVRRILAYCGLEFEATCLEFYNNERAVNTASSEQVRQPIYHKGLEAWRPFDQHLLPLKNILNPLLIE